MADLAELGIRVRYEDPKKAAKKLKDLETQATKTKKATDNLGVASKRTSDRLSSTTKEFSRLGSAIEKVSKRVVQFASFMAAAFVLQGIQRSISSFIETIAEFDQALYNLQAITKATRAEALSMGDAIRDIARATKFSAGEVADGMRLIGQAGFSASESIHAVKDVATLATGTMEDFGNVVDLVTTTIRAFNLETVETNRVADIFATAINESKLSIDKLRKAFNYVGAAGRQAGLTLEETSGALMILANNGIRASTMGTGLRRMLLSLAAPNAELANALRNTGMSLDDINPKLVGMDEALRNLTSLMWDAESATVDMGIAKEFFGVRAAQVAGILGEAVATGGSYSEMVERTKEIGSATRMAELQQKGLQLRFKNLQDRIKNVAIALGEAGFNGVLSSTVDMLRGAAESTESFFNSFPAVPKIMGIATGVAAVTASVSALKIAAVAASGAFKALWAVMTGPIGWITAAITSLVYASQKYTNELKEQSQEHAKNAVEIRKNIETIESWEKALDSAMEQSSKAYLDRVRRFIQENEELSGKLVKIANEMEMFGEEGVSSIEGIIAKSKDLDEANKNIKELFDAQRIKQSKQEINEFAKSLSALAGHIDRQTGDAMSAPLEELQELLKRDDINNQLEALEAWEKQQKKSALSTEEVNKKLKTFSDFAITYAKNTGGSFEEALAVSEKMADKFDWPDLWAKKLRTLIKESKAFKEATEKNLPGGSTLKELFPEEAIGYVEKLQEAGQWGKLIEFKSSMDDIKEELDKVEGIMKSSEQTQEQIDREITERKKKLWKEAYQDLFETTKDGTNKIDQVIKDLGTKSLGEWNQKLVQALEKGEGAYADLAERVRENNIPFSEFETLLKNTSPEVRKYAKELYELIKAQKEDTEQKKREKEAAEKLEQAEEKLLAMREKIAKERKKIREKVTDEINKLTMSEFEYKKKKLKEELPEIIDAFKDETKAYKYYSLKRKEIAEEEAEYIKEQKRKAILESDDITAGFMLAWKDYVDEVKSAGQATYDIMSDTFSSVEDSFRDHFRKMLDEGISSWEDFGKSIADIMKDTLADIATYYAKNEIKVAVTGQGQGIFTGGSGGSGGGGMLSSQRGPATMGILKAIGGTAAMAGIGSAAATDTMSDDLMSGLGSIGYSAYTGEAPMTGAVNWTSSNIPGASWAGSALPGTAYTSTMSVGAAQAQGLTPMAYQGGQAAYTGGATSVVPIGVPVASGLVSGLSYGLQTDDWGAAAGVGATTGLGAWGGAAAGSAAASAMSGTAIGASIGSIVPGIGTAIGSLAGALIGGGLFGGGGDDINDDAEFRTRFGSHIAKRGSTHKHYKDSRGNVFGRMPGFRLDIDASEYISKKDSGKILDATMEVVKANFDALEDQFGISVREAMEDERAGFHLKDWQDDLDNNAQKAVKKAINRTTKLFYTTYADNFAEAAFGEGADKIINKDVLKKAQKDGEKISQTFYRLMSGLENISEEVPGAIDRIIGYIDDGLTSMEAIEKLTQEYQQVFDTLAPAVEQGLQASIESTNFEDFQAGLTANLEQSLAQTITEIAKQELTQSIVKGAFDNVLNLKDMFADYFAGETSLDTVASKVSEMTDKVREAVDKGAFQDFMDVMDKLGLSLEETTEQIAEQTKKISLENEIQSIVDAYKQFDQLYQEQQQKVDSARQDYINSLKEEESQYKSNIDELKNFIRTLEQFQADLLISSDSPLGIGRQYNVAKSRFGNIANEAMTGDTDAIERLQGASSSYLEIARRAGIGVDDAFADVQKVLNATQDGLNEELSVEQKQLKEAKATLNKLSDIENKTSAELRNIWQNEKSQLDTMKERKSQFDKMIEQDFAQYDKLQELLDSSISIESAIKNLSGALSSLDITNAPSKYINDVADYANNKLWKGQADWTSKTIKKAMQDMGLTINEHKKRYDIPHDTDYELPTDPQKYINKITEYANEEQWKGRSWDTAGIANKMSDMGLTLQEHYRKYGDNLGFASGGTVSGPDSGYFLPTTFHGTEHITPDSEMTEVKETLGEIKGVLTMMLNTNGDQSKYAKKMWRILDGSARGDQPLVTEASS